MKKTIIAKAVAVCSAAVLGMLGVAAFAQKNMPNEKRTDIQAGKFSVVGGIVTAKPGETVKYPVYIENNTENGFAASGIRLFYGDKLQLNLNEKDRPVTTLGVACDELNVTFGHNSEWRCVGCGTMGDGDKDNGLMFTVELVVPVQAENGIYPIVIDIDNILDHSTNAIEYQAVNGCIYVTDGDEEYPYSTAPTDTAPPSLETTAPETTEPDPAYTETTPMSFGEKWGIYALEDRSDLVDGKTNIIAGIVEAEAGETVKFPVYIANNSKDGFAATGLRLFYDDMLTPTLKEDGMPNAIKGEACDAVITKFSHNAEKHIIGLDTMGDEPETDNGLMFTVEITVPSDAKGGDKFPMTLEVDKWLDAKNDAIDCVTINGYIYVMRFAGISPSDTAASSGTAATASSDGSTTTAVGTTKGANVVQTTTAKSGTTNNTTATKTGDAGVGAAVAGLLLAAGTAVVAKKKKD